MKTFIILFVLTVVGMTGVAQSFTYLYDDAGNRTDRIIVLQQQSATITKDTTEVAANIELEEQAETPFTELFGEQEIKVYPNPTKGELKVTFNYLEEGIPVRLLVFNSAGALLIHMESLSSSNRVNLSSRKPGMYIMRIVIGDKTSEWKIIKE